MKRFHMPEYNGGSTNLWYSFDYGIVHCVVMSSEHDFRVDSQQYKWINRDLQKVNRSVTPWVIFFGHRPMYSSANYKSDYIMSLKIREALEPLLMKYKVDLANWAHYHRYRKRIVTN